MEIINEGSSLSVPLSFTDDTDAAVTPSAARYKLDDLAAGTSIIAWTSFAPSASTHTLVITAAQNARLNSALVLEEHRLTVEITYGTDSKKALSTYDFAIRKIGVTTSTQADYISAITALVGGALPLGEKEQIIAINQAVKKYSGHSPREVIEDETGNGSFDYALTLLTYWTDKFSTIKKVEYPVNDTESSASVLQDDAWSIYKKPAGSYLRMLENKPATTESLRITYTALHLCNANICTIPERDEEAVQMLAAAGFCDMLATYFAQTQDSIIQADSVDHKSKASEYAARARTYRTQYYEHMGIKPGEVPPASVTRDQDTKPSWGGTHLTHPRKWR